MSVVFVVVVVVESGVKKTESELSSDEMKKRKQISTISAQDLDSLGLEHSRYHPGVGVCGYWLGGRC